MSNFKIIKPGFFNEDEHWYPKALNATIHPVVNFFLNLDKNRIISRYTHLNPSVNKEKLEEILAYKPSHFLWSGADLMNATTASGIKSMLLIENNSSPSGQKSMPLLDEQNEQGGYKTLIENSFNEYLKSKKNLKKSIGSLAVIYDKNYMEASGYASAMSDFYNESVYLISLHSNEKNDHIKVEDGYLNIFDEKWIPLRGVFRYVTQKPWNRIPISTKTAIYNPIIACLAGGRNKMMAAKAYEFYNAELEDYGLHINTPETIREVNKEEIPFWVKKMGGYAVIKVPYSNAGQGVFTIVNEKELDEFMKLEFEYKKFIIQSLIGNYNWSSHSKDGKFYHVGTIPNLKMETYVVDVRMMVISTENGIKPVSVYSRRAEKPLSNNLSEGTDSWAMLGTNLSVKLEGNKWESETNRLMLMDRKDFNKLGISIDSLIEAYIQTVLSTIAIDKMSKDLVTKKGSLKKSLFKSLNNDATLIKEILDF